ncbi:MAG: sulfate adenylyltransferase, partial [SAR324 cluster bacterium]|nr:sulfate adenylyltransferase [SAR324 cluster bacterium]
MIKPYGSYILTPLFVKDEARRKKLLDEAEKMPSVVVSSAAAANAVMLGGGYFNPLRSYMNLSDVLAVTEDMQISSGLLWPTPVINMLKGNSLTEEIKSAEKIALRDPNVEGNPVIAIQSVEKIEKMSAEQIDTVCAKIYGTSSTAHPGVAAFVDSGDSLISGPVEVLNFSYFSTDFPDTFRTAVEIRYEINERGWETVIAFQTRNPMHRAHEELCRMAQKELNADGILVHMLLGKLKKGDIPAEVRNDSIRKMVELYFPANTVMVSGYGFDMLYAGPREAVLHAIFRQNAGCSHLIVGRDHAGVGDYYGAFDAQTIFDTIPEGALQIKIFRGDHT